MQDLFFLNLTNIIGIDIEMAAVEGKAMEEAASEDNIDIEMEAAEGDQAARAFDEDKQAGAAADKQVGAAADKQVGADEEEVDLTGMVETMNENLRKLWEEMRVKEGEL